ncbi:hypothetical protein ACH9D2_18860 [Kocuria sp. M4R2S49]|uniref:hypothetical protein n=1 Tax=Kocuria rhizosphaericola TaxID=3376284 RepID=UPI0037B731BB
MSPELIAALAAMAAALIAAVVSLAVNRDDRKKALDEAEVLVKLKSVLPADAPAVQGLIWILAQRTERWRKVSTGRDLAVTGMMAIIPVVLLFTVLLADTVLHGRDALPYLDGALDFLRFFAVMAIIMGFVLFFVELMRFLLGPLAKRWIRRSRRSRRRPPWATGAQPQELPPHT